MSDAAAISNMVQTNLAYDVSVKIASKAKDVAQQQGDAAISLLEGAAELTKSLSQEAGKGVHLDTIG